MPTLEELRDEARDRGLTGFSTLNKADLEALLAEDDDGDEETLDETVDETVDTAAAPEDRDDDLLETEADPLVRARLVALTNGNVAFQTGSFEEGVWTTASSVTITNQAADELLESARNVVQEARSLLR
jgi:hypothetical protein